MDKTLVILAAGMGSRYGGLKQIDPVGPNNSIIIDYSIYDALRYGFNKVVFIIKKENEEIFREVIGDKVAKHIKVEYVFQSTDKLPEGFTCPEDRIKPWGTAHAIYCCKGVVNEPFMVINSDDFYGKGAFKNISEWMDTADFTSEKYSTAMSAYFLKNTLTDNGTVSRGVCDVDDDNKLIDVVERTKIKRVDGKISYTEDEESWVELPENAVCSMNCWGFPAEFLNEIEKYFIEFLKNEVPSNPLKSEFFLPFLVRDLLSEGKCAVDVLETADKWFGVTYKEDKPDVVKSISALVESGEYPERLWD
ncbi:MAG: nucleotidyltransferase [Clostridia bacterium]|nr:nucleotidyltransferase [Clostridia bacterium]